MCSRFSLRMFGRKERSCSEEVVEVEQWRRWRVSCQIKRCVAAGRGAGVCLSACDRCLHPGDASPKGRNPCFTIFALTSAQQREAEDCSGLKTREGKRANSPPGSYGSEKEWRPRSASSLPGDGEHRSLPAPSASIWPWALWCATPLLWAVRCLQAWLAMS